MRGGAAPLRLSWHVDCTVSYSVLGKCNSNNNDIIILYSGISGFEYTGLTKSKEHANSPVDKNLLKRARSRFGRPRANREKIGKIANTSYQKFESKSNQY